MEEYRDLIRDLSTSPGLNTLVAAMNRTISSAMVTHLVKGFLGLEESEEKKEKKPLSLSFLSSLLDQMENALAPGESFCRSTHARTSGSGVR